MNLPPKEAADAYEMALSNFFGDAPPSFDLILLGLGDNGHTASLFPGTDVLNEQVRWVKEVYVEEVKMYRITMTVPLINKATNILFLVSGTGKAGILKEIFSAATPQYPAQLIVPEAGSLYWFVDKAAAGGV